MEGKLGLRGERARNEGDGGKSLKKKEERDGWEDQMVEMMLTKAVSSYYVSFTDSITLTV